MKDAALAFAPANGLRYGLLGLPLAFVALPLYAFVPHHYASEYGVPLALLGALLLGTRLLDAFIDPLIGRWVDRLYQRSARAVLAFGAGAAAVLAAGFALLFFPPPGSVATIAAWAGGVLMLTYASFSALSIAHQSWAAMLGGVETQRGAIVAWRESCALVGVLLAAIAPPVLGLPVTAGLFAALLAVGCWAWSRSVKPFVVPARESAGGLAAPFESTAFKWLLAIFMLNGIASAVPATLVLFFVQDRLQARPGLEPMFLATYFACAALSIPLWLAAVRRLGLARTWLAGIGLAIASFAWTAGLGAGDTASFIAICAVSGAALGTDLVLPGALLAGVIQGAGARGQREGAYFGWWNFATKLNLALAAGLALPLLGWAGYAPGSREPEALAALSLAYGPLPCALKAAAALLLYFGLIRPQGKVR